MTLSLEAVCPECGATEFYKAASMELHLGTKRKWHCPDCDYGFVTINGIDTSVSA
jgi:rubredoxin